VLLPAAAVSAGGTGVYPSSDYFITVDWLLVEEAQMMATKLGWASQQYI
jgi:hypothetical protein